MSSHLPRMMKTMVHSSDHGSKHSLRSCVSPETSPTIPTRRIVRMPSGEGSVTPRVKCGLSRGLSRVHSTELQQMVLRKVARNNSSDSIAPPARIPCTINIEASGPARPSLERITSVSHVKTVSFNDIELGGMLDQGSFTCMFRVKTLIENGRDSCKRHSLVLKCLHEDALSKDESKEVGTKDLASEAAILSRLPSHENIVVLYAVSTRFWEKPSSGFIVMEQLAETLDDRLCVWKIKERRDCSRDEEDTALEQRERIATAALGIARALAFLHKQKILYRNLKTRNIGFDKEGTVRLFDFGIALDNPSEDRLMTLCAGTPRYMAPEVFTNCYSFPADIYSFSVLLWQICTLQKPYSSAKSISDLKEEVTKGYRPTVRAIGSSRVSKVLKAGWHPNPSSRPSMDKIVRRLERESEHFASSEDLNASSSTLTSLWEAP